MSATLSVVIADDEPLARERVRMLLAPHARFRVVGEASTGDEALAVIRDARPDIVFLDISMPGPSGVEVAHELVGQEGAPAVVFVTAHDEFALQAFEVSAIDYLVKPLDRERFEQMLARVARRVTEGAVVRRDELVALLETLRPDGAFRKRFVVRTTKGHYFVLTKDVEAVVAEGNYVALSASGRQHLVRETMKAVEDALDPAEFVRIHRSTMVRIDAIARVEPAGHGEYRVFLKSGAVHESSRAYSERLRTLLR